ncbi:cysteine protease, putative, partial [Perkinsus marinus ATCC 50983]
AIEGLHKNLTGDLVSLPEGELIDCSSSYWNTACLGGLIASAFEYVMDHGIGSEKDNPYKQASNPNYSTCRSN